MSKNKNLTVEDYLAEARNFNAYFFRAKDSDAMVVLNHGRSRITLAYSFLGRYARGNFTEGDALAREWAEAGSMPLSDDLSIYILADAIYFSCSDGRRYKLRRAALRAWMNQDDGWKFPRLEHA